jgi:hypothetical protein
MRKSTLIVLIAVVVLAAWTWRESGLRRLQRQVNVLAAEKQRVEEQMAADAQELETLRARIADEKARDGKVLAEMEVAQRALAKADPESRWAEPPASTPDWNAESPYIWVRKEMVPKFSVPMFTKSGAMQPGVGSVLAVDDGTMRSLNSQLERLLADYRTLEVAGVRPSDKHLAGVQGDGTKATIEIPPRPEDGARFKARFEAALNEQLGFQRASLILESAEGWIDSQFSGFGTEPKIISLIRLPNGGFTVSIKSGQQWFSCGVPADRPDMVGEYIPPHLLPLFKDVLTVPAAAATAIPPDPN